MNKNYTLKQRHLLKQMKKIEDLPKNCLHPLNSYSINTITRVDHKSTLKSESFIIDSAYTKQFEKIIDKFLKTKSISYKRKFYILLLSLMTTSLLTAEKHNPIDSRLNIKSLETSIGTDFKIQEAYLKTSQQLSQNGSEALHTKEVEEKLAKIEKMLEMNAYLEEYSSYFNLDSEKVINLAREATNDYEESFAKVIKNDKYDLTNPEAACMLFVYELQVKRRNSKIDFNCFSSPVENLKLSEEIKTVPHTNLGTLVLESGYSFPNYIEKISELFGLETVAGYNGTIATLSLSFIEAGETTGSDASHEKNNFFGMTGETDLLKYATPESCIISAIGNLFNNYNRSNDLDKLAWKYNRVPENLEQWKSNFRNAYYKIEKNYGKYFDEDSIENSAKLMLVKPEEK